MELNEWGAGRVGASTWKDAFQEWASGRAGWRGGELELEVQENWAGGGRKEEHPGCKDSTGKGLEAGSSPGVSSGAQHAHGSPGLRWAEHWVSTQCCQRDRVIQLFKVTLSIKNKAQSLGQGRHIMGCWL